MNLASKEYINLLSSHTDSYNSIHKLSKKNKESLKEIIEYLSELNKNKLINEKQFSELILIACANYIENEIGLRIEKQVNNKVSSIFGNI